MPAPLTPAERAAIAQAIRDGKPRNAIARDSGRSLGSVSAIAAAEGLSFDRAATKSASAAKQVDNAGKRVELARLLWDDALRLRGQLWQPVTVYAFGGRDNDFNTAEIPEPDARAKQHLLTSVGIAVDKALTLEAVDRPSEAKGAILALVAEMQAEREADAGPAEPEAAG